MCIRDSSEYFAPILGYTGTISDTQIEEYDKKGKTYTSSDIVGKAGIESSFEKYLDVYKRQLQIS